MNSRRTDYSLVADDTVAYYYALTDTQLATDCQVEYERLDGRVITWHTRATTFCASLTLQQLSSGWARNRPHPWLRGWRGSSCDPSKEGLC